MTGDPQLDSLYGPLPPPHRVVRVRLIPWVIGLLLVGGLCIGAYYVAKAAGWLQPVDRLAKRWEAENNGIGIKSKITYPVEPTTAGAVKDGRDLTQEQLNALRRDLAALRAQIDALQKQPKSTPAKTPPPPPKHRSMLFVKNEVTIEDTPAPDTYHLAAGTWIPCTLETLLHSEIEGAFTVKTRQNIFDSETGTQLLIPQGRSIVAKAQSADLVFGNERIPTFATTLSLPGKRSVDLGNAPIMDGVGTNGLTGEVHNHTWRIIWTRLFIESLRSGQQIVQQEVGANPAGTLGTGLARGGSQAAQARLGRAQDTRPTIIAAAGDACNVLLPKAVHLPAVASR